MTQLVKEMEVYIHHTVALFSVCREPKASTSKSTAAARARHQLEHPVAHADPNPQAALPDALCQGVFFFLAAVAMRLGVIAALENNK